MGTKNNPGKFDCYTNAEPDEPMFVLLARDPAAEYLTAAWAAVRAGDVDGAGRLMADAVKAVVDSGKKPLPYQAEKSIEAQECARNMRTWRLAKKIESIEKELGKPPSPNP